jgi:hypothetical protein
LNPAGNGKDRKLNPMYNLRIPSLLFGCGKSIVAALLEIGKCILIIPILIFIGLAKACKLIK